jgi:phosphoglycolate phosphatase
MVIKTVLFDLDGTLADTAPDLAFALNTLLKEHGRAPLPYDIIRPVASHGGLALVQLGFSITADDPQMTPLRTRLLEIYRAHIARETRLFPGMPEVLDALALRGCNWGVVTNKPAFLTEPLLDALDVRKDASCVVSGDTTANRKPHPEPMLLACRQTGSQPDECLYIGDAERDIEAGRAAGIKTLVALFGYLGAGDRPEKWGADGMIRTPQEILDWIH